MRKLAGLLALTFALAVPSYAGAVAQGRGTPARLQKADLLRKVRAGKLPTQVNVAAVDKLTEMSSLVSPSRQTVHLYQPYKRVLFLSDGLPGKWETLAEPIHQLFPDKLIVKGDFEIQGTHTHGNYTAMHIDNTMNLPLHSGSHDLVVMRRGLCLCHGSAMCGGLKVSVPQLRRFFAEVYRVLDKSKGSVAYLHGAYGDPRRVDAFRQAADQLMVQNPEMKVELVQHQGQFHAVRITHEPLEN